MRSFILSLIVLIFLFPASMASQSDMSGRYTYAQFDTAKQNDLIFRLETNVFFKNNEYFSDYTQGYTLPGFILRPEVVYYAGNRLKFTAGANLIQFFGDDHLFDVKPVVSAQLRASDKFFIILGALKGNLQHGLIEPVYDPDNQYFRPVENGLQFLFNSRRFSFDTWLDWEQFISWGDTVPERFTAGFTGNLAITGKDSKIEVGLPVQLLASHQSGQISDYNDDTYSMLNTVLGLKTGVNAGSGFIRRVWVDGYYLGFSQFSGSMDLGFESGYALYPLTGFDYKYGQFMVGYWYADNFYSLKGNQEFMSISDFKDDFYSRYRNMGTAKATFYKSFMDDQIKLNVCFNVYYDFPSSLFDYSYGVSLIYTPEFRIINLISR